MRGFLTFIRREISRFLAFPVQAFFAPLITAVLFILVFGMAIGGRLTFDYPVSYIVYIASGLIIQNVFMGAFMNPAGSIIISKFHLSIVDIVTYPIRRHWVVLAYGIGGMIRGLGVGFVLWVLAAVFVEPLIYSPLLFVLSMTLGGLMFSLMGTWLAFQCTNFDQISVYMNFLLMPVLFLSGVFFPTTLFPEPWRTISVYNPVVYLVEMARYGMTGVFVQNQYLFFVFVPLAILLLWYGATQQLKRGIKMRI